MYAIVLTVIFSDDEAVGVGGSRIIILMVWTKHAARSGGGGVSPPGLTFSYQG